MGKTKINTKRTRSCIERIERETQLMGACREGKKNRSVPGSTTYTLKGKNKKTKKKKTKYFLPTYT